jgi:hypothetical protein
MRFLKKNSKNIPSPAAADDDHVYCCCGRRQDNERRAGRIGKMVSVWHCSKCSSVQGKGLLNKKCADCAEKLSEARAALIAARRLERDFSERVTNPLRMAKTGEVYIYSYG